MDYFEVRIKGESNFWKKFGIFSESLLYLDKDVQFNEIKFPIHKGDLKIKLLNNDGNVILSPKDLFKKKLPDFSEVSYHKILFKNDLLTKNFCENINGIEFVPIELQGDFDVSYSLLNFSTIINCIDFSQSKYEKYIHSVPVLKKNEIPKNIDGFFLSGWHSGEEWNKHRFLNIVNDKLRLKFLSLNNAVDFLIFTKVELI
ncbi:hypothetical protein [Flavobacterium sp. GSB-24]|uniref:hypothetical protein n=1 Tax=Flavobacterium sp. GSB-24 TaxID=2994319 RepID=UPI00248F5D0B|nr:hypothetical protein [Flavobacterium sp. GSB-24]BDU24197.1 hypothetical protein FLGSB24_09410 [Flavobacterium sp. GSB-24]